MFGALTIRQELEAVQCKASMLKSVETIQRLIQVGMKKQAILWNRFEACYAGSAPPADIGPFIQGGDVEHFRRIIEAVLLVELIGICQERFPPPFVERR